MKKKDANILVRHDRVLFHTTGIESFIPKFISAVTGHWIVKSFAYTVCSITFVSSQSTLHQHYWDDRHNKYNQSKAIPAKLHPPQQHHSFSFPGFGDAFQAWWSCTVTVDQS